MIKSWIGSSFGLMALALVVPAAQASLRHHVRHVVHRTKKSVVHHAFSAAENGLIGVHLFDSSEHVIGIYGSPDDVQPLTFGSAQQGGFGGGNGFGAPGGAGAGRMPGGPGGKPNLTPGGVGGGGGNADTEVPQFLPGDNPLESQFDFGDSFLQAMRGGGPRGPGMGPMGPGGPGGGMGPMGPGGPSGGMGPMGPGGPGMGRPGMGPGGPGGGRFPGAGGGKGMGGGGGGTSTPGEAVTYTRWIYNRQNNKFAFVVNRLGQIIQIEAIGLTNPKVKTARGIGFGSHFGTIIKAYHNPDGYEIGGDNILVKYLIHDKVAFRLTRIGDKQPHQVTGIVVSAGRG